MNGRSAFQGSSRLAGIPDEEEVCLYIAEMCVELRRLAKLPRFRTINYLLDMARLEAERTAKDLRGPKAG